jgi:hypothetical protein
VESPLVPVTCRCQPPGDDVTALAEHAVESFRLLDDSRQARRTDERHSEMFRRR